jgi:hypothetical protein
MYKIAQGSNTTELETQVNALIAEDYVPSGSMVVISDTRRDNSLKYMQPMYKAPNPA